MRQAVRQNKARKAVSRSETLPAPVGGWNARDALSAMQPTDAVQLTNWIPDLGGVRLRSGNTIWASGLGSPIESLMEYAPQSGNSKLFAAVPSSIFDVSASGAVGAAVQTGLSNGRWQHTMFSTAAGTFLCMANGADAPRYFDGSAWTNFSFTGTGLTLTNLIQPTVHMNRLWFVENGKLRVWYLPVQAIAGTASSFDLGSLCKLGGQLMAMAAWSRDGGTGPQSLATFVTSMGEVLIYQGTDPVNDWHLVGIFRIPLPLGRRCLVQVGADLGVLTVQGFVPLSSILSLDQAGQGKAAATDKIVGAFKAAAQAASGSFGWQAVSYPTGNLVIINVPISERTTQQQYVMNANTGAWCQFTGMNAGCWSTFGSGVYWGGNDGNVYQYDVGNSDWGGPILATLQTAFTNLGSTRDKRLISARPFFISPPNYAPLIGARVNYDTSSSLPAVVQFADSGAVWDVAAWDVSDWGAASVPAQPYQGLTGVGEVVSLAFSVSTAAPMWFNGSDLAYEIGAVF